MFELLSVKWLWVDVIEVGLKMSRERDQLDFIFLRQRCYASLSLVDNVAVACIDRPAPTHLGLRILELRKRTCWFPMRRYLDSSATVRLEAASKCVDNLTRASM